MPAELHKKFPAFYNPPKATTTVAEEHRQPAAFTPHHTALFH